MSLVFYIPRCDLTLVRNLRIVDVYQTSMAILILLFISRAFGNDLFPADNEGVPVCIDDRRTVSNIILSCLATIFASTWLAIHPNVPGRKITDKGAISGAVERAKIRGIAILAPEVIVSWAAEQFMVAWRVCHGAYFVVRTCGAIQLTVAIGKDISVESIIHGEKEEKSA